jgi:hypothetical protein
VKTSVFTPDSGNIAVKVGLFESAREQAGKDTLSQNVFILAARRQDPIIRL